MDRPPSSPPDPARVRAMLDRFAEVLAQVMFGNYEVRAYSDEDDAFADFAMYLNTLIAALQRSEEEVAQYQDDLEKVVEERTAALREAKRQVEEHASQVQATTAQLIQAEKLRALGEMTAGVAHEMNQPLNGIRLICQDMLRDIERGRLTIDSVEPNLQEVVEMVDKMALIVDEMRLFSRAPSELPRENRCDANQAIEGVFRLLGQQLRDRGIETVLRLDRSLPPARADAVKLEQVVMNLIANARDAVLGFRDAGGRVEVASYQRGDGSEGSAVAVVVQVSDNGPGMTEQVRSRAFEPFFTTKDRGEGTGLGLAIAHQVVLQVGGRIELETAPGQGAVFRVVLPKAR